MAAIIESVREQLLQNVSEKTKESSKRFFKEEINPYGVKSAIVGKISKQTFKLIEGLPKSDIFDLCEELWESGMLEESFIACNWAYALRKSYSESDFLRFEKWVNEYVSNWASCDTFCTNTIGSFLELFPDYIEKIIGWTTSNNRWVKRASAVSLINPATKGLFKQEIFEIADRLLLDPDDMVQKGYGWMLKSLAETFEDEVFQFVLNKKSVMPRTALRYAIEKMPEEKRRKAMSRS